MQANERGAWVSAMAAGICGEGNRIQSPSVAAMRGGVAGVAGVLIKEGLALNHKKITHRRLLVCQP